MITNEKQEGLLLELERMKVSMTATSTNTSATAAEKINIQHLIPRFVENSDISTYLKIFERQEQVNIDEVDYVTITSTYVTYRHFSYYLA
ncbi:hypothetical protein TNIN_280311 [Trichonephila inaurata madagascariensis]|uniref:Uncharacterized protein n=1 Tax=Trichonephila inaurata madagascariensis TaxID=2747483 RepID=A0A8X6XIH5_9ARAC|nr:hypothetical protein TNIN_280311 [Trichonephila inaurata madagascariensis]